MNKLKITYWITTGIFSAMMLFSATMYFTSPDMAQTFEHLGFPDYFRIELGIAKIIGVILLLAPFTGRLKEWVYAGFTINMISGSIAHAATGDPISAVLTPIVLLVVLAVSYTTFQKLDDEIEPAFVAQLIGSAS
ncbi:DoxX family protein [Fodinibius saliphilus]|uniref:DoxX family protein n=1 Tax=Fodinibius saliphilus TaxID=1920650 RepID=UPI00110938B8|nr:DoxX family protein [Fodinibius saliphilus]